MIFRGQAGLPWVLAVAATLIGACVDVDANQVTSPVVLGMTSELAPVYDDGQQQIYQVQIPVPLPVRTPLSAELSGLR